MLNKTSNSTEAHESLKAIDKGYPHQLMRVCMGKAFERTAFVNKGHCADRASRGQKRCN